MTLPFWVLWLILGLAFAQIGTALLLILAPALVRAWHEWRWRRRKARHGGDLIEQLERWTGR